MDSLRHIIEHRKKQVKDLIDNTDQTSTEQAFRRMAYEIGIAVNTLKSFYLDTNIGRDSLIKIDEYLRLKD